VWLREAPKREAIHDPAETCTPRILLGNETAPELSFWTIRDPRSLRPAGKRTFSEFAPPSNLEPAPALQSPQRFDARVNKPLFVVDRVFGTDSFPLRMRNR
jgi:hypothetical protein